MFQNLEWWLGLVMVLTYAYGRFNTPKTNRASTTLVRFWFASLSYYVGIFLLYLLLASTAANSPTIATALGAGGEGLPASLQQLSGPLLSALILTALLPNFPVVSRIDQGLLKFFQDMGDIPLGVRLLAAQLRRAETEIPPEIQKDARDYVTSELDETGLSSDDLCFTRTDTPEHRWTLMVSLMTVLRSWESRKRYSAVLSAFPEDFERLKEKFQRLNESAVRCFPIFRARAHGGESSAVAAPGGAGVSDPVAECRRTFRDQCEDVYVEMTNLIARGVLKCEFTRRDRNERLSTMGFVNFDAAVNAVDANRIVASVAMIFVILITGMLAANVVVGGGALQTPRALMISMMVAVIYGAAIVCALMPKSAWAFARRSRTGGRPFIGYAVSAIFALAAAIAVSIAFKSIALTSVVDAARDLRWTYPWFCLSSVAAATIAYLADDFPQGTEVVPGWARWAEGAAASLILVATSLLTRAWLLDIAQDPDFPPDRPVPDVAFVAAITGSIGFWLGVTIPHWYRSSTRKKASAATSPQPALVASAG